MTLKTGAPHSGVFSLMLTPFMKNGEIDWKVYDEYVDWQLAAQPNGLFAVCGSSEMKWLTLEERLMLARQTVSRAGSTPVLATANLDPNPDFHKEEIRRMCDIGVSGIVLVPPNDLGKDQGKLGEYFGQLVSVSECTVYLYEWPQTNPYFISPTILKQLVSDYGIKGIKDTTCTMEGINAKISTISDDATIFQANTPFMLDSIISGARGVMAITSTAFNELVVYFWKEASNNPSSTYAQTAHQYLVFLDSVLRFAYPATAKYLATIQGINMELTCRWPIELHPEAQKAVSTFYEVYKKWEQGKSIKR